MRFPSVITAAIFLLLTPSAFAVKIADITRMDGARTNVLTGMGLVIGLKGTGDGGAYLPAMRPLANMLKNYADPSSIADLSNAANVAIVECLCHHARRRGSQRRASGCACDEQWRSYQL